MSFAQACVEAGTCLNKIPFVAVGQRTTGAFSFVLRDSNGQPYDLIDKHVELVLKGLYTDQEAYLRKSMSVDEETSTVTCEYTEDNTKLPGIWLAQATVFNDENEREYNYPFYMEIGVSLDAAMTCTYGPPSVAEIRMSIRDTCPEDNFLLDDVEFRTEEIVHAIRKPIDQWNETPPPIASCSPGKFPYRYHWMKAIIAELLLIKVHSYMRNRLDYAIVGGTVQDKAKSQEYLALARMLQEEWTTWMRNKKVQLNVSRGWGTIRGR